MISLAICIWFAPLSTQKDTHDRTSILTYISSPFYSCIHCFSHLQRCRWAWKWRRRWGRSKKCTSSRAVQRYVCMCMCAWFVCVYLIVRMTIALCAIECMCGIHGSSIHPLAVCLPNILEPVTTYYCACVVLGRHLGQVRHCSIRGQVHPAL